MRTWMLLFALIPVAGLGGCGPKLGDIPPLERNGDLQRLDDIAFGFHFQEGESGVRRAAAEASARIIRRVLERQAINRLELVCSNVMLTGDYLSGFGAPYTLRHDHPWYREVERVLHSSPLWSDDPEGLTMTVRVRRTATRERPCYRISQIRYSFEIGGYVTGGHFGTQVLPKELVEHIQGVLKDQEAISKVMPNE